MAISRSPRLAALARWASRVRLTRARVTFVVALGAVLGAPAFSSALTPGSSAAPNPRFHGSGLNTGAWLVQFRPEVADTDATKAVDATGATEIGDLSEIDTHVLNLPVGRESQALAALARDPRVASVEKDGTYEATVVPTDPHWTQAWGPRRVRAPAAWNLTKGIATTVIAIVDTGVDKRQPDLLGRVLPGWDFQNDDANPKDDNGHGTAVAGVAAATANNGIGIAGMCWRCKILPVKVLNRNGRGNRSNIAAGIVWATDHGADVINMSLAGTTRSTVIENAVNYARDHGVVVVAAAGNEGSRHRFYPAAYPGVISVGATNGADALYPWSNRGAWVKVSAPGCAFTGKPGPAWTWWCGTSFATPVVAGIAALIKSYQPTLKRSQIEKILLNVRVHVRGIVDGRVDAVRALRMAASLAAN